MSLKLNLPGSIYVGGQTLRGEAELHFPQVVEDQLEEVHVKLRGTIYTRISRQVGQNRVVRRQVVPIIAENRSLWTRSPNYSATEESQILRLPFEFVLPPFAPPCCQYDAFSRHARIGYFVEVVGSRSGLLSRNKRVRVPISVVPQDVEGEQIAVSLRTTEPRMSFRTDVAEKKIRRGFFGEYATVRMEFSIPDIPLLPLFTPIPYILNIVTRTKPMKKDDADKNPLKALFPSPPTRPSDICFRLKRHLWLKAHWFTATGGDDVTTLGGMESATSASAGSKPVEVEVSGRNWIPSETDKNTGVWLQEASFRCVFVLTCPPSFQAETLHIKYSLDLKVDFPGLGNALLAEVPVHIASGLSATPPSYEPGSDQPPPPTLELPPSYWRSAGDWEEDEKGEK